jgi:hypothetical protein
MEERIIELPPFTPNWLVKFDQPVKNLKAELGALANGRVTVILHSALTDMPSNKPSMLIHREWVSKFWVLKYALGDIGAEFHELTEEHFYPENYEFPEETPSIEQQNQTQNQNQTFLGSSGNFLGSSNLSYSSGNIWREER